MKKVRKRILAAVLTVLLTLTQLPATVRAAQTYNVGSAAELTSALSSFQSGDTIRLTTGFTYNDSICILDKTVTFDLNSCTLNVEVAAGGYALYVKNGNLLLAGAGALNIANNGSGTYGVDLEYGGSATVTNIRGGTGASVEDYCSLTVTGNITAQTSGIWFDSRDHLTVTVGGDVTVSDGPCGIQAGGYVPYGASAPTAFVNIGGNVTVGGGSNSYGIWATDAIVTVGGAIISNGVYIELGGALQRFTFGQGALNEADDYFDYTFYLSKVRLKAYPLTVAAGAGGTVAINGVAGSSSKYQAGSGIGITAFPSAGYHFNNWSSPSGSFANASSAGTTFTMPRGAVTVQANFAVNTYTVTFNSQGGSAAGSVQANYGTTIAAPPAPTRTGYTFGGWYKEAACTTAWNFASDAVTGNTTLYAKWTAIPYTVTFNSQGGSAVGSVTANYNSIISAPPAPSRTGYTFGGWYKEAGCTTAWNFASDTVTGNTTLYAKWTLNIYTVTFDSRGGSAVDSAQANHGAIITAPAPPTHTGYTFGGWYKEAACTNAWTFASDTVTGNTTLYAKWTPIPYTVTFDSQGGSAVGSVMADYDTAISAPVPPTRTGYTFGGWYKEAACTSAWNFASAKIAGDTTLYAKWTLNTYTVTFDSRGGSAVGSVSANHGATITAPAPPTRTGYTFGGWYKEAACTNAWTFASDTVTGNTTLYAKWTPIPYTVTFDSQGGSAVGSVTADYDTAITEPAAPTRTGYTFGGWFREAACTTAWNFASGKVTGNTTLYAKWTLNTYIVTFDSQGGSAVGSVTADYDTSITEPAAPTRTGYTFGGWYREAACTTAWNFASGKVTGNITLYAKWTINQYTVTFESNGGSGVDFVTQDYNTTVSKPADPTKTGYTFGGWYTDSGLTCPVAWPMTLEDSDTTLYAKWTANTYTVHYDANGSQGTTADSSYTYGVAAPLTPNGFTKAGYSFTGWATSSSGPVAYSDQMSVQNLTDQNGTTVTLYAKWTSNSDGGGGSAGSQTTQAGQSISQALSNGQTTANITLESGNVVLNGADLTQQNANNLTVNVQYPDLQISLNPNALPAPAADGSLQVNATPVTEPGALHTLYVMAPDGRGIGVGYNITINYMSNGQATPVTQLSGEITLTFDIAPEDLQGIDPASLRVYMLNEETGQLEELGGAYQNGRISVATDHLCRFIIMGKVAKERISGADRYLTAVAISQKGWTKTDTVILTSGENYADALTGAALAGIQDAPILLTGKDSLNQDTLKAIDRLQAKKVIIVGGTDVVAAGTETKLQEKYQVERIQGTDRYQTAIAVGEKVKTLKNFDTVILATAQNYPDALAMAPFAAKEGTPILYTAPGGLNAETRQAITAWGIKKVIIAGGTGAVPASVENEIKNLQISVERLGGTNRYLTALAIAKYYGPKADYARVVVATGESFADALAGASFAAKKNYPVILTGRTQIVEEVLDYLGELKMENIYILGGEGAVSDKVKEAIY